MTDKRMNLSYRMEIGLRRLVSVVLFLLAAWWIFSLFSDLPSGKPFLWQYFIFPALLVSGGLLNLFSMRKIKGSPELAQRQWTADLVAILATVVAIISLCATAMFLGERKALTVSPSVLWIFGAFVVVIILFLLNFFLRKKKT
jgi:hypothetical protein